jgi:MFS family permease
LGDRVSRKRLIPGALIFWSACTAETAIAQNFWQLTLCRALGGLGEAFYFPATMSLIGDYHGRATRSRAMSLHQSGVYAGTIAGGALAGWIAQPYGWRSAFSWFGAAGVLLAGCISLALREPKRGISEAAAVKEGPAPRLPEVVRGVLANRLAWLLILAFIGANFVAVVFLSWMPSFLYRKFSMSLTMAG